MMLVLVLLAVVGSVQFIRVGAKSRDPASEFCGGPGSGMIGTGLVG